MFASISNPYVMADNKNILVTRFAAIGDVAMTIPTLYDVCQAYPEKNFFMMTNSALAEIFINKPNNLSIIGIDLQEINSITKSWALTKETVKKHSIDLLIDLQDEWPTQLMRLSAHLSGVKTIHIDKGLTEKKHLIRASLKILLPLTHAIDRYRETFSNAGFDTTPAFENIFPKNTASPSIYSAITEPKHKNEKWIGIAPFAKYKEKIYPLHLMEQVLRDLSSRHNTKIFLFGGGPYEQKILSEWARKYPSTITLAGKDYGLNVEMALFHDLDAMITMDSANMQMASLAGAPVLAIWGATHPYCGFGGWKIPEENNIQLPVPCRPCSLFGNKPCITGNFRCMTGINPSIIIDKVNKLILK